tara:strand:- start:1648 stop:2109 length:462 start_codon:yes stop_codon:yes gene_type:complete
MSQVKVQKGRSVKLSIEIDGDMLPLCYLNSKDITVDLPVAGVTDQCTTGSYTEAQFTGYKTFTLNISGNADLRAPEVSTPTKYAYQQLLNLVYDDAGVEPCAVFQIDDELQTMSGTFNITNFAQTDPEEELSTFTATLQKSGDDFTRVAKTLV